MFSAQGAAMSPLGDFPVPQNLLPPKLKNLMEPVTPDNPHLKIEVAASFERNMDGDEREALQMLMVAVPVRKVATIGVLSEASQGVVAYPLRLTDRKGALRRYAPDASGFDPIVMSWGSGSYFAYNLSEKVWMSLGLSPRCFGNLHQRIVYDDPAAPEFAVADGEISNSYYFKAARNVSWKMRNDYLRRNTVGMRIFYYETLLEDQESLRILMKGKSHYNDRPDGGWYELALREWNGKLLLRVWASVAAVQPKLCAQTDIHKLVWPGDNEPMAKARVGRASAMIEYLYLRDTFLERYEQNSIYDTVPVRTPDGVWLCSPSYGGQWSFAGCQRVGRNLVRVDVHSLYTKAVPDREILHAHAHAIAADAAAEFPPDGEHIAAKTRRLLDQLLRLGETLSAFGDAVDVPNRPPAVLVGFDRAEVEANGLHNYRMLCRLAQAAPLEMTQAAFLARCKTLNEILQKALPNVHLKALLRVAGCTKDDLGKLGSLKLLQGVANILDWLIQTQEDVSSFDGSAAAIDWRAENEVMSPLFITYDLRNADAHVGGGEWLLRLEQLGFDTAQINDGFGRALDFVLDRVIESLRLINAMLTEPRLR
jgi:hypothetical protein